MVDPESLRNYRPPQPELESIDGARLTLYCGDDLPEIGSAVAVVAPDRARHWAVVRRHAGARRVHAWAPCAPDWVAPGMSIELASRPAAFDFDPGRRLRPGPEMIRPLDGDRRAVPLWPEAPEWSELDPERHALGLGIDVLDVLAPVASGGLNLVVDTSPNAAAFRHLARRTFEAADPDTTLVTAGDSPLGGDQSSIWRVDPGSRSATHIAALQCTIALAADLRRTPSSLAVVELPALGTSPPRGHTPSTNPDLRYGFADIVDRLGRHLVSTKSKRLTSLLRLHVPSGLTGLDTIIDTLSVGDVDATIFVDAESRFDPRRSHSGADVDEATDRRRRQLLQTLDLASRARDKGAIFGDQELTDAERRAIDEVDALRPSLRP